MKTVQILECKYKDRTFELLVFSSLEKLRSFRDKLKETYPFPEDLHFLQYETILDKVKK